VSGGGLGAAFDPSGGSLVAALERHLDLPALSLPLCPESVRRARARFEGERDRPRALREIALGDVALVTALLREANGPDFDGLARVASVERACERLGRERVEDLFASILTASDFEAGDGLLSGYLHYTWRRAGAIATVAGEAARMCGRGPLAERAALLGLVSETGVVYLLSSLQMQRTQRPARPPLSDSAVREVLAQLHEAFGIRLLERWNFAGEILDALSDRPQAGSECKLLQLARHVVASAGIPSAGLAPGEPAPELWDLAEGLDLRDVDVAALQVKAEDAFAEDADSAPAGGEG
jgi:HD-like signal output (HDOD) protein